MNTNTNLNERLLMEAKRIGDQLLAEAETDSMGVFWQTMSLADDSSRYFSKSESVYAGVSGIVLFLLELYKKTGENVYLDFAQKGLAWAVAQNETNPSGYPAFLTGGLSVPFALLRMHQVTGERKYLDQALKLAYSYKEIFVTIKGDDFLGGIAGIILGLLHLHAASHEPWILETMDTLIHSLLTHANHGPVGLYWERSGQNMYGLCGFAHGSAGIGFVFLELGHYFHNETFYRVAEQAFLYERYFYFKSQLKTNWPDLRRGIYVEEDLVNHRKAYLAGDMEFFARGGDMNAWCHGAAGIGLTRLRASQLLSHPIYTEEARFALEKTEATTLKNTSPATTFTLCHGAGGNAELFLYAYTTFQQPQYWAQAEAIAVHALDFYEKDHHYLPGFYSEKELEDRSLFMGNAGIGYFLLRVLNPMDVPSILLPQVNGSLGSDQSSDRYPFISISQAALLQLLLKKDFPRTLRVGEAIRPQGLAAFFRDYVWEVRDRHFSEFSMNHTFMAFIEGLVASMPEDSTAREKWTEAYTLEKEKRLLDETIIGFSYEVIREKVQTEHAEELTRKTDSEFLALNLVLNSGIRLFTTRWNWNLSLQENPEMSEDEYWLVLLKTGPMGINEIELNSFCYAILYEFQETSSVQLVVQATIEAFEALTPQEEESVTVDIIQQIKQALVAGILVQKEASEGK